MMVIESRSVVPLGLFLPRVTHTRGIRRTMLIDPEGKEYHGPIYFIRELRPAEYWAYYESAYGVKLSHHEKRKRHSYHFYEISID